MKWNLSLILIFLSMSLFSQKGDTLSNKIFRDKSIIALPVVFRFPETGWGGGVAGTASWTWAKDSLGSKPSQGSLGLTFTQNKQVLAFFPFQVFFGNNKYFVNADIGWYKYNYFYFGIGENTLPQERYDVKYPRVKLLFGKQLNSSIYGGFRINYEEYNITGTEEGGELSLGIINGSQYSRTAAIGPAIMRDTRD